MIPIRSGLGWRSAPPPPRPGRRGRLPPPRPGCGADCCVGPAAGGARCEGRPSVPGFPMGLSLPRVRVLRVLRVLQVLRVRAEPRAPAGRHRCRSRPPRRSRGYGPTCRRDRTRGGGSPSPARACPGAGGTRVRWERRPGEETPGTTAGRGGRPAAPGRAARTAGAGRSGTVGSAEDRPAGAGRSGEGVPGTCRNPVGQGFHPGRRCRSTPLLVGLVAAGCIASSTFRVDSCYL